MSCKETGKYSFEYKFSSHSGPSVSKEICTITSSSTGIMHIVTVTPVIHKYHDIRVTGKITSDPATAKANFNGGAVKTNGVEWEEIKGISTLDITFNSAEITFVGAGSENIETKIEEKSRWSNTFNQIDQNDLAIQITLVP